MNSIKSKFDSSSGATTGKISRSVLLKPLITVEHEWHE